MNRDQVLADLDALTAQPAGVVIISAGPPGTTPLPEWARVVEDVRVSYLGHARRAGRGMCRAPGAPRRPRVRDRRVHHRYRGQRGDPRPTVTYAALPAVWLRPLEEPVRIAASTARFYRARVQAQATGMTAQDITRAAADAEEHQRDVAGQALDSYRAEQWLRIAEVQHQEWRRISALMTDTTRKTYAPKSDPEAVAE